MTVKALWRGTALVALSRLVALLWTAAMASPAAAGDGLTYGSLHFDESGFDFGDTYRGSTLTHRFRFTNNGPGPLTIQGVHSACSCTAVEVDRGHKYASGESGSIDVSLDTTDFSGVLVKTVTVISNETLLPDRTLTLRARVRSEIYADPPLLDFGEVRAAASPTRVARIKAAPGQKLDVSGLDYNQAVLTATLSRDHDDWLVTATLLPTAPPGFLKEMVTVHNNSAHLRKLPLPVRGEVLGNIDWTPAYLEFGALASSEAAHRTVTLHSASTFKITATRGELVINGQAVSDPTPYLKMEPLPVDKDTQQLKVELKNPAKQPGSVRGKVYIETTDPLQKEVSLDFYALFR